MEICIEGLWSTIVLCDESWSDLDAKVICSQLRFNQFGKSSSLYSC